MEIPHNPINVAVNGCSCIECRNIRIAALQAAKLKRKPKIAPDVREGRLTIEQVREIRFGDEITVRYGSVGTQRAKVERPFNPITGKLYVRKYRANSGRWTGLTAIVPREILDHIPARARK